MSSPSPARTPWWKWPSIVWWRSLPLRVISSVFLASVLVLVLGGFLLMQRATNGVLDGKREAAESDARQAVSAAQQQLDAADLTGGAEVDKILVDLATSFANRSSGGQFETIILAPGQTVTAGQADTASIPSHLREQVEQANALLITPTEVHYRDGRPSVAGLAAGSTLTLPGIGHYQIYLRSGQSPSRHTGAGCPTSCRELGLGESR
jgi:two-component system sensor histidine kinase MtrB